MSKITRADVARLLGTDENTVRAWKHRRVAGVVELDKEVSLGLVGQIALALQIARGGRGIDEAGREAQIWRRAVDDTFTGKLALPGESVWAIETRTADGKVIERAVAPGAAAFAEAMSEAMHAPGFSVINLTELCARTSLAWAILMDGAEVTRAAYEQRWADLPQADRDGARTYFDEVARRIARPRPIKPRVAQVAPQVILSSQRDEETVQ